ncbi:hypothetical protein DPMN_132198 [Dreissena polymorpha]|uniref:Uncharacterized protein n=1 Tax=Dreissena polymorpha TaxID=45954 RepID=A0A9D4FTD6_DREPO|nr:hypothetical protein DPMN_132198 [Dreissena polymorpha]
MNMSCYENVLFVNCSQCSNVTPVSELTNTQTTDLKGLSAELKTVLGEIKSLQNSQEASFRSLQAAYKEHAKFMIERMRFNINTTMDECGKSSVSTLGENEQFIKEEICAGALSILNEFDESTVKELTEMKDDVKSITCSIASSIYKRTGLQNELTQLYENIPKLNENKELCLIASIKCKEKIKQAFAMLGKSGKVFAVQGKSVHNVRMLSDSLKCSIRGICVLADGHVLLVDYSNKNVKLLNLQYQVVSHLDVAPYNAEDICQITPSKVAIAANKGNTTEVQFITVNRTKMLRGRKLQLQHECRGIAHYQGDLLICSGTALYKYALSGKLVCRLYEDPSHRSSGKEHGLFLITLRIFTTK